MKHLNKIIFLSLSLIVFTNSFSQKQLKDTIILKRGRADTLRSKVFIDPNKNSKNYDRFSNFGYDENYFAEKGKALEDSAGKKVGVNKLPSLPKKWIPLYLFKGEYYVYLPCDGIYNYGVLITDAFICDSEEGTSPIFPRELNSLKMISKTTYVNSEIDYEERTKDLHIDIIDKKKGIAVFSTTNIDDNSIRHRLMVDANKVRLFTLIKNDCHGGKEEEFDFEEPDFKKLLGKK